jgi:hypothetical protein
MRMSQGDVYRVYLTTEWWDLVYILIAEVNEPCKRNGKFMCCCILLHPLNTIWLVEIKLVNHYYKIVIPSL